jgi:hypothetical protein
VKIAILFGLTLINIYFSVNLSVGDRYMARLNKWYSLALENNWNEASKLEKKLDQADLKWFKDKYKSENLKKRLNQLTIKSNKNADDWMEIAQIQNGLNDKTAEKEAIKIAHESDLIRSDIEKIYFSSFFSAAF